MKVGQVIGSTDKLGGSAASRPVHYQDVLATIYHNLGIDPHAFIQRQGRPARLDPPPHRRADPRADLNAGQPNQRTSIAVGDPRSDRCRARSGVASFLRSACVAAGGPAMGLLAGRATGATAFRTRVDRPLGDLIPPLLLLRGPDLAAATINARRTRNPGRRSAVRRSCWGPADRDRRGCHRSAARGVARRRTRAGIAAHVGLVSPRRPPPPGTSGASPGLLPLFSALCCGRGSPDPRPHPDRRSPGVLLPANDVRPRHRTYGGRIDPSHRHGNIPPVRCSIHADALAPGRP